MPEPENIFEQMQFDYEVADTAVQDAVVPVEKMIKLIKSLDGRNEESIHNAITDLDEARKLVPDAIEKLGVARGSAKTAAYDLPSVKAHKDEIVAAVNQIATWEKHLLKLDSEAEKLREDCFKKLEQVGDVEKVYEDAVQAMRKIINELEPDLASVRAAFDAIYEKALRSVELHNANGLQLCFADADDIGLKRFEDGLTKAQDLEKKAEQASPKISGDLRMKLAMDFGHCRGKCKKLAEDVEHFRARKKAIKALKAAPLDLAKALKTLGLPPDCKAALAKALVGDDPRRIKALDELSAKAKPSKSGKDMLAALHKANLA